MNKLTVENHPMAPCPRCGRHHRAFELRKLFRPIVIDGHRWNWWARCPVTNEPIIVQDLSGQKVPD